MKTITTVLSLYLIATTSTLSAQAPKAGEPRIDDKFFNGENLTGWKGNDGFWSVKEKTIVGHSDKQIVGNEFIWSDVEVRDFYLSVDVKLVPQERNAGIQFRSKPINERGQALGYQADVGGNYWGKLYHEHGRRKLDWNNHANGVVKHGQWNRYEILAVGHRIWTALNGKLCVAIEDPEGELSGKIAFQIHGGEPQTVHYRQPVLTHNPKIELAGMNEQQLVAKLRKPLAPQKKRNPRANKRPGDAANNAENPSATRRATDRKAPAKDSPNVLVILTDDLGWKDVGYQGSTFYETPHIDRLSKNAAVFRNFYAACNLCSPTRAALMTGKYPQRVGFTNFLNSNQKQGPNSAASSLPADDVTIGEAFQSAGYRTGYIGKWHLGPKPHAMPGAQGFDWHMASCRHGFPGSYFFPYKRKEGSAEGDVPDLEDGKEGDYLTTTLTTKAIGFIEETVRKGERPFFLTLGHYAVHTPIEAPQNLVNKYEAKRADVYGDRPAKTIPDIYNSKTRAEQSDTTYAGMIESLDTNVGRLMASLERLGIAKNTIVVFTSDNGGESSRGAGRPLAPTSNLPLRAGKGWNFEGGIRVPMFIAWPGRIAPTSSDERAITMDIYPTLLELAGIEARPQQHIDGLSLASLIGGKTKTLNRPFLAWWKPHARGSSKPSAAIIQRDWKLIRYLDSGKTELFHLAEDQGEKHDLAAKVPAKRKKLNATLTKWIAETTAKETRRVSEGSDTAANTEKNPSLTRRVTSQPTTPKPALDEFELADGLETKPFATDQLANPTTIDIDDRGRVWVGESVNYRKKERKEGDRILILEDTNGDGRADSTKVFYQNPDIDGVHGVCVLGNQVIVSVSDRIIRLTDSDGDDKADKKELMFKGKLTREKAGQHDHSIHAVMAGPDGRLYFNFGNFNGELRRADGSLVKDIYGQPVDQRREPYQEGMVIRCESDGSRVEVLGHNFRNNWEVAVDSFGSMWQSDNDAGSSSCRINFVMEHGNYGYKDEMTGADYRTKRTNLEETVQRQMWHQNDPGVVPNLLITGSGAPAGIVVYEGELLPKQFHGQMIHAEPGRNTVWSFPVESVGAGYTGKIVHVVRNETDRNYRPCDISVAPDGSLFIADWYDPIDCCHRTLNDAGRLFRAAPAGHAYSVPKYNYTTAAGAAAALRSPNLAARFKARTALVRMGVAARDAVTSLAKDTNPRIRARALWVLADITDTPRPAIELALQDDSPDIRTLALRIARRHQLPVESIVARLVDDQSALVRRECAVSLFRLESAEAVKLWTDLALRHDGQDRWYLEALGIGAVGKETACLTAWQRRVGDNLHAAKHRDIIWRSRAPEAAALLADLILNPNVPANEHPRLLRAFDFHTGPQKQAALATLLKAEPKTIPVAWLEAFQRATPEYLEAHPDVLERANSAILSAKGTSTFVDLVARLKRQDMTSHLMDMVESAPETKPAIQALAQIIAFKQLSPINQALNNPKRSTAVIKTLAYVNNGQAKSLLSAVITNESQSEATRLLAISSMSDVSGHSKELVRLVEEKKLPPEFIPPAIAALTLSSDRISRAFAAENQHLIVSKQERWPLEKLLAAKPDVSKGPAAFQKGGCIKCHKVAGEGKDFGPDLSAIGKKLSSEQLFAAIMKPSETISLGYETVTVITDEGKLHNGFIASETDQVLTLNIPGGLQVAIPKDTIDERIRSKVSLMPKGIDAIMHPQELVDVVGWLRTQKRVTGAGDAKSGSPID